MGSEDPTLNHRMPWRMRLQNLRDDVLSAALSPAGVAISVIAIVIAVVAATMWGRFPERPLLVVPTRYDGGHRK